jgi:hypothetical protein
VRAPRAHRPDTGSGTGGGNTTATNHEQAVKFAECNSQSQSAVVWLTPIWPGLVPLRRHGVAGYPDPQVTTNPGANAAIAIAGQSGPGAAPAFQSAQKACSGILLAQSATNGSAGPSEQEFLAFAHCLHAHGVSDFPDPDPQGQITGQMIDASGVDLKAPSFTTVADACVGVTHGAITRAGIARLVNRAH